LTKTFCTLYLKISKEIIMISVFLVYNVFEKFDTSKLQAETVGVATLP